MHRDFDLQVQSPIIGDRSLNYYYSTISCKSKHAPQIPVTFTHEQTHFINRRHRLIR